MSELPKMHMFSYDGSFNLYYLNRRTGIIGRVTTGYAEVDMLPYALMLGIDASTAQESLLLNSLIMSTDSADRYFDYLFNTASPMGLRNGFDDRDISEAIHGKARYIHRLNDQNYVTNTDRLFHGDFCVSDFVRILNPGTLALLSLPAYMAAMLNGVGFIDQEQSIGFGAYDLIAPPPSNNVRAGFSEVTCFQDYLYAFFGGNFETINIDAFITIYGFAACMNMFAYDVENSEASQADDISEVISWQPFCDLWDYLVEKNALNSPFAGAPAMYKYAPDGIENAREVNPDLADALLLSERFQPFPLHPKTPGQVLSTFYGLIEYFNAREYFCIPKSAVFEFPSAELPL